MFVSTARYAGEKSRDFAQAFASASGSVYSARGKKTVEKLVSMARKKGENTIALVLGKEIAFISVSASDWKWKNEILKVKEYKIGDLQDEVLERQSSAFRRLEIKEAEIGSVEGADAALFEALFGTDSLYGGETTVHAEKGKLKFSTDEKTMLEIEYEISREKNEEQRGDDS